MTRVNDDVSENTMKYVNNESVKKIIEEKCKRIDTAAVVFLFY